MNIPNKPDGSGLMDIPQEPVPDATFIAPAYLAFSRGTTQKPECHSALCRRSEKSLSLGAAAISPLCKPETPPTTCCGERGLVKANFVRLPPLKAGPMGYVPIGSGDSGISFFNPGRVNNVLKSSDINYFKAGLLRVKQTV